MRPTLFYIPEQVGGWPLFGLGVALAVWLLGGILWLLIVARRQGWSAALASQLPMVAIGALVIAVVLPHVSQPGHGIAIRGYGVFVLLGIVLAVGLAMRRCGQMGIDPDHMIGLVFWLFVLGIIGARTVFVIEYWPQFQGDTFFQTVLKILDFTKGGLVVFGSLIGGMIGVALYVRMNRLPLLAVLDLIAPSMALGLALGRIGCLMNGCCFGGACELPWAIQFPDASEVYTRQLGEGLAYGVRITSRVNEQDQTEMALDWVDPNGPNAQLAPRVGEAVVQLAGKPVETPADVQSVFFEAISSTGSEREDRKLLPLELSLQFADGAADQLTPPARFPARTWPVHPTQIYSSVNAFLLCLVTLAVYPYRKRDGQVFALLLILYGVSRFVLEIIRSDEPPIAGTPFTLSQNVALVTVTLALALLVYVQYRPAKRALPMRG